MRLSYLKIVSIFFMAGVSLLMGREVEAVLFGIIAIIDVVLAVFDKQLKNINNSITISTELSALSESIINETTPLQRSINQNLAMVSILTIVVSAITLLIKILYYGINYITSIFQTVALIIMVMPFGMSFLIKYLLITSSKNNDFSECCAIGKIHKLIYYSLSSCVGKLLIVLFASSMGWPLFSSVQFLLIKLLVDVPSVLVLSFSSTNPDTTKIRQQLDCVIFEKSDWLRVINTGIALSTFTLNAYLLGLHTGDMLTARSLAFFVLLFSQLSTAISIQIASMHFIFYAKLRDCFFSLMPLLLTLFIQLSVSSVLSFHELFGLVQLSQKNWIIITVLCLLMFLFTFVLKKVVTASRNIQES